MERIRTMLACVCAVIFLGAGITGPVLAETKVGSEKTVVITVNINKADAKELAAVLHNIGETKAEAIVKYRDEHGSFSSKEQLSNVKGIGASTVKKNAALITL